MLRVVCYAPMTAIPKELPAVDCLVEEPNAPSGQLQWLLDFTNLRRRARLEGIFF